MSRKQVLVQLDDEQVRRLDAVAADMEVSHSDVLGRGALAVLEAHRPAEQDRMAIEAYSTQRQDPAVVTSARRLAGETAPRW